MDTVQECTEKNWRKNEEITHVVVTDLTGFYENIDLTILTDIHRIRSIAGAGIGPLASPGNEKSSSSRAEGDRSRWMTAAIRQARPFACIKAHLFYRNSPVASDPALRLRRRGWRPQQGDQRQDVGEHLSRHCHLGHMEGDVAAVANDLRADLDQLFAQAGQRPRLRGLRHRQGAQEVAEIVGQGMKLKAHRVGGEGAARQSRPLDRILAFLT